MYTGRGAGEGPGQPGSLWAHTHGLPSDELETWQSWPCVSQAPSQPGRDLPRPWILSPAPGACLTLGHAPPNREELRVRVQGGGAQGWGSGPVVPEAPRRVAEVAGSRDERARCLEGVGRPRPGRLSGGREPPRRLVPIGCSAAGQGVTWSTLLQGVRGPWRPAEGLTWGSWVWVWDHLEGVIFSGPAALAGLTPRSHNSRPPAHPAWGCRGPDGNLRC